MKHSLHLVRQGKRQMPTCSCSWRGVPHRNRDEAERQYHGHVAAEDRAAGKGTIRRGGKRRSGPAPRQVTPHDQLPPELR